MCVCACGVRSSLLFVSTASVVVALAYASFTLRVAEHVWFGWWVVVTVALGIALESARTVRRAPLSGRSVPGHHAKLQRAREAVAAADGSCPEVVENDNGGENGGGGGSGEGDGEGDDDGADPNAAQLASRAMEAYNTPISNLTQADVYGNDLNLPKRERKLRKFLECFAEDVSVQTVDGRVVLRDFEELRKRYGTVFRESGATLRGTTRRRFVFGDAFVLDFERHESLVTPRPGLSLDGAMGVMPPRTQDLVVLYRAEGGELAGMWIAPDKADLGGDAKLGRAELEATELFKSFRALVERLSDDDDVDEPSFQSFVPAVAAGAGISSTSSTSTGTPAGAPPNV